MTARVLHYDGARLLVDPDGPGAKGYDIRRAGSRVLAFVTGGVNGNSADDTAIRNLADVSECSDEPLELWAGGLLPTYFNGATRLAIAEAGIVRMEPAASTIDPDVALREIRHRIAQLNHDMSPNGHINPLDVRELVAHVVALDRWLVAAGELPAVWLEKRRS